MWRPGPLQVQKPLGLHTPVILMPPPVPEEKGKKRIHHLPANHHSPQKMDPPWNPEKKEGKPDRGHPCQSKETCLDPSSQETRRGKRPASSGEVCALGFYLLCPLDVMSQLLFPRWEMGTAA